MLEARSPKERDEAKVELAEADAAADVEDDALVEVAAAAETVDDETDAEDGATVVAAAAAELCATTVNEDVSATITAAAVTVLELAAAGA